MANILNRFELASFKRMFNNALSVSKISGHSLLYVLFDMSKCILRDNVGYMEYNLFHFIDKPDAIRKTYVDYNCSQILFKTLNDEQANKIFDNKLLFNERFKKYIGRNFIDAAHCDFDDFSNFCKGKSQIFCKPKDSCSGKGIYKIISIDDNTDLKTLHSFMINNDLMCEDVVIQHDQMNNLNSSSINTVRITTVLKDDIVYPMYSVLRIGTNNSKVDNVSSGGIYTVLSDEGKIINPCWSDKTISTYSYHPTNNFSLIGFEVPFFKQAVELCKKAALIEKKVRYVGWDVAICKDGPIIIEGNQLPGYDMPQNYYVTGIDEGLLPKFEKILGKIR